jgi:hypothetical protein
MHLEPTMFDHPFPVPASPAYGEVFRLLRHRLETPVTAVRRAFTLPRADDYVAAMVSASRQRGEATFDWLASATACARNQ